MIVSLLFVLAAGVLRFVVNNTIMTIKSVKSYLICYSSMGFIERGIH